MPENEIADQFAHLKPEDFKKVNTNDVPANEEQINNNPPEKKAEEVKEDAKPEQGKPEEVKPAETKTPETPADNKPAETKPAEQTQPEQKPATPEEKKETPPTVPVQSDWKADLKKVNRDEALKELGLDEFEISLLKYRKEFGDLTPFLEAKSVDYSKLSDEEIMRRNLRSQYKGLSDEEFDLLYQDEVTDKYKLDSESFDANQMKLGAIKLKVDAEKVRQSFIEEQKKFVIPEKAKEEKPDNTAELEAEMLKMKTEWETMVKTNDATKKLLEDKRLVLGSKESTFNYELDNPAEAVESAMDNTKFWSLFKTESNETNFEKFYKVRAYAANPEKFEKALIDYGKSLGRKAEIDELKNPSKPEVGSTHQATTGDFFKDVGQAFLERGVRTKQN